MEEKIFKRMLAGNRVRITKSFREYWGSCRGKWFYITAFNCDKTVTLQDDYHASFRNVPIKEIIF